MTTEESTEVAADERVELEEERAFLFTSLDDLDAELAAGDIAPEDHAALHDDYTARAAAVLRRLDELDGKAAPVAASARAAAPSPAKKRRLPMVLGLTATAALAVLAGVLVTRSSGERLPGQEATGQDVRSKSQFCDDALNADEAFKAAEALRLYDQCISAFPDQAEPKARKGWLLVRAGYQAGDKAVIESGLRSLDAAVATDPSFTGSFVWRGLGRMRVDRDGEAICDLRTYLATAEANNLTPDVEKALDGLTKKVTTQPTCAGPKIEMVTSTTTATTAAP